MERRGLCMPMRLISFRLIFLSITLWKRLRLANTLDEELQKLRCRVNYHALRFTKPIQSLGQKLVKKMRKMGSPFIAIHLRFEPDMLAFSGCYYGGGEKERKELGDIRKRWATLPEKKHGHKLDPIEIFYILHKRRDENKSWIDDASEELAVKISQELTSLVETHGEETSELRQQAYVAARGLETHGRVVVMEKG